MSEVCPVTHIEDEYEDVDAVVTRSGLAAAASQDLIDRPAETTAIIDDLNADLHKHYERMLANPERQEHAEYRIARTLRSAALASFYHISATELEVAVRGLQDRQDTDWTEDLRYRHVLPLSAKSERITFQAVEYRTVPMQAFAVEMTKYIAALSQQTYDAMAADGVLEDYATLAKVLPTLHTDFAHIDVLDVLQRAESIAFRNFLDGAAQDTADTLVRQLIVGESARERGIGQASPDARARYAISQRAMLTVAASVSRPFESRLDPAADDGVDEETAKKYWAPRRLSIEAYESAVSGNRPMSEIGHFAYDPTSGGLTTTGIIQGGRWRRPEQCVADPELVSYNDPTVRFRTAAAFLAAAACIAERTIYADWPDVSVAALSAETSVNAGS